MRVEGGLIHIHSISNNNVDDVDDEMTTRMTTTIAYQQEQPDSNNNPPAQENERMYKIKKQSAPITEGELHNKNCTTYHTAEVKITSILITNMITNNK